MSVQPPGFPCTFWRVYWTNSADVLSLIGSLGCSVGWDAASNPRLKPVPLPETRSLGVMSPSQFEREKKRTPKMSRSFSVDSLIDKSPAQKSRPSTRDKSLTCGQQMSISPPNPGIIFHAKDNVHFHHDPIKFYQQSLLGLPSHLFTDCILCIQAMSALTFPVQNFGHLAAPRDFAGRHFYPAAAAAAVAPLPQTLRHIPATRIGSPAVVPRYAPYPECPMERASPDDNRYTSLNVSGKSFKNIYLHFCIHILLQFSKLSLSI